VRGDLQPLLASVVLSFMKNLIRLSLVLLALATAGLFAQTAPTTNSNPSNPTNVVKKVVKKGAKQAKHKKKHAKKHAKKS
jgi:hypothetical protein